MTGSNLAGLSTLCLATVLLSLECGCGNPAQLQKPVPVSNPGAHAFRATGPMAYARSGHTATLLADRRVLIAGGYGLSTIESHAEIFDPVQGAFQAAGTLTRGGHTATRLSNGDVLFAGGVTADPNSQTPVATASAELFRTATGLFQPTGNMIVPRKYFASTLLLDGRVLVTGGITANEEATDTAELYDPKSGTFSLAAKMNYPWSNHSAFPVTEWQGATCSSNVR